MLYRNETAEQFVLSVGFGDVFGSRHFLRRRYAPSPLSTAAPLSCSLHRPPDALALYLPTSALRNIKPFKSDLKRLYPVSALPIFPGRRRPSIFGASELNFRVRDGNGWTLTAINTDYIKQFYPFYRIYQFFPQTRLVTRTGFEPMLPA